MGIHGALSVCCAQPWFYVNKGRATDAELQIQWLRVEKNTFQRRRSFCSRGIDRNTYTNSNTGKPPNSRKQFLDNCISCLSFILPVKFSDVSPQESKKFVVWSAVTGGFFRFLLGKQICRKLQWKSYMIYHQFFQFFVIIYQVKTKKITLRKKRFWYPVLIGIEIDDFYLSPLTP